MRVSSLSNARVRELISTYFVPTWLSRDHYQMGKPDAEEQRLVRAIDTDRHKKKFEGGSVCVYIATGKGVVLATMTVQKASKPDLLIPFLEGIVAKEKLTPRDKETAKASAAPPPEKPHPASKDGLLFTVRTRLDAKGPNRGTSRDLVELTRDEWAGFLPKEKAKVGDSWTVPEAAAAKLLRLAYPPLGHWNVAFGKLEVGKLEAKVVSIGKEEVALRLEGELVLLYPHQNKPTDGKATAKLLGVGRVDPKAKTLTALEIVTEGGVYLRYWEGKPITAPMSAAIELTP